MKKNLRYLTNMIAVMLIILASVTSCDKKENGSISVTDVTLNYYDNRLMEPNEVVVLTFGTTMYLFAVVSPENATNQKVTWKNSDESVATFTVFGDGNRIGVNAIAEGITTITVTTEDGKKTASCIVYVHGQVSPTIDMKVSYGSITDRIVASGSVLNVNQGTYLNFKIRVTQGSWIHNLNYFRITSWTEAESTEIMILEEKLNEGIFDSKPEYEFQCTVTMGNSRKVLFFELSNYSREVYYVSQVTIELR